MTSYDSAQRLLQHQLLQPFRAIAPYNSNDNSDDDPQQQQQQEQTTQRTFANNWDESVFLFCAAGLGLTLNLCVIVRIMIRPDIRKSIGGAFVIHSCLLDTVKCLFCIPFAVSLLFDQQPSHCTLLGGAFVLVVTASGFNIVAMVCCEAYRFSERDITAMRGDGLGISDDDGVLKNENVSSMTDDFRDQHSIDLQRCSSQEIPQNNFLSGTGEMTSMPSECMGYSRFDNFPSTSVHSRMQVVDSNCRHKRPKNWFQTSEPNLYDSSGIEVETYGSQPQTLGRNEMLASPGIQRFESDGNLRFEGVVETLQPQFLAGEDESPSKSLSQQNSLSPCRQNTVKESNFACVFFGIVMVYVGSLIVHLGPTIIGGDFNYNDPIGNCLFAYGNVKSYVVQAMWIVIMSLAMLGAIFYLIRFNRHVKSKTGRRLAALVRSSIALSRGRLRNSGDHTGQSLELRRISLGRVRVLCLLTTVFVACWYPLYILTLADPKFQRSVKLYKLLTFVAWSNSSINPLVLILFDRDVGLSSSSCRFSEKCISCKCPCGDREDVYGGHRTSLLLRFPQKSSLVPLSTANQSQASSNEPVHEASSTRVSTPLASDRIQPLESSQPVLTPSRIPDSNPAKLDCKTRSQLEALASQRQSAQGRDLYSKIVKANRLFPMGRLNKKLSKQDLIHLRKIGSRLGTPDTFPLNVHRLTAAHFSASHPPLYYHHHHHHHPYGGHHRLHRRHHHHPHHHNHRYFQHEREAGNDQRQFFYTYKYGDYDIDML